MDSNQFYKLDYSHEDLERLLNKINDGYVLTKDEKQFLLDLMGKDDSDEETDAINPIDPDEFVKESEVLSIIDKYLAGRGIATISDLDAASRNLSKLHNSDLENHKIEVAELLQKEIDEVYKTVDDYLDEVFSDNPDIPDIPSIGDGTNNNNEEILNSLEDLTQRMTSAEEKIVLIEEQMNSTEEKINSTDSKIEVLEETIANMGTEIPSDIADRLAKLENMLDTPASYTKPSASISVKPVMVEAGVSTDLIVTPSFNKGDAGDIISCTIDNGYGFEYSGLKQVEERATLSHKESIVYTLTINYGEGPKKQTSMGNVDNNNIKAGTVTATATVKGYAASYYGSISGSEVTESDIASFAKNVKSSKSFTGTYTLSNARSVYMYPKDFGALTSIKDANGFDYIEAYTLTIMNYNGVDYNIYVLNNPTTISNFKQTFN